MATRPRIAASADGRLSVVAAAPPSPRSPGSSARSLSPIWHVRVLSSSPSGSRGSRSRSRSMTRERGTPRRMVRPLPTSRRRPSSRPCPTSAGRRPAPTTSAPPAHLLHRSRRACTLASSSQLSGTPSPSSAGRLGAPGIGSASARRPAPPTSPPPAHLLHRGGAIGSSSRMHSSWVPQPPPAVDSSPRTWDTEGFVMGAACLALSVLRDAAV